MIHSRTILAIIGMFSFLACGQWAGQALAEVHVDVGGVHVQVGDSQPPPPPEGLVVLTRGPLHEAFAEPVTFDEGPGFIITRRPPAPIEEIIPDEKPEGNHIVWIPGYWSWDSDRDDFIWVSGCWRAVPPSGSWVSGYWAQDARGYRWIAGFWDTDDTDEIEYLPAPPATLEEGPQGAGSPDSIWVPGCWVRHQGRYAWRAGFWEAARPNWVWVPAQYIYTPRGYVYAEGYWDYSLERRGVAFLPVYCPSSLYARRDFRYSPDMVIDLDGLTLNLFISPQRHHYYFGDYYGDEYARAGYRPWYEARDHHDWYDPIFVHQQWRHHDDHQWYEHEREGYDHRRDDRAARPARTYDAMRAQEARMPEKDRKDARMGRPMKEVVSEKTTPFKFEKLDTKRHEDAANQQKEVHAYKDKRSQWESPSAKSGPDLRETTAPKAVVTPPREPSQTPSKELPKQPVKEAAAPEKSKAPDRGDAVKEQPRQDASGERVKISRSPIAVREASNDKELTPPPRPKQPTPDPDARPKASKADAPDRSRDKDASDKDKDKDKADSKR